MSSIQLGFVESVTPTTGGKAKQYKTSTLAPDLLREMITRKQILGTLTEAFPDFVPDSDNVEMPYIVLGDFARFLIDVYNSGDKNQLMKATELIERFHLEGDSFTKEAATVGLLEGIQNTWEHAGSDPERFADALLPESRRWWDSLNKFWQKEIPHVGADITTNTEQNRQR